MSLPFTRDDFLAVFARYNHAVWPAQFILAGLAVLAVLAVVRKWPQCDRIASGVLALLWLWSGLVYHIVFFSDINRVAIAFGVLFLVQSLGWFGHGIYSAAL